MDAVIREAGTGDLETVQDFNHRMSQREAEEFDPTIDPDFPLEKKGRKYFRDRIREDFAVVAEVDGEPVGYAVGAVSEPEFYRTTGKIAELENMYVTAEYRSRGIGSRLVKRFREWAMEQGADRLRVEASSQNTDAIRFYRKNGFSDYSLTLEEDM